MIRPDYQATLGFELVTIDQPNGAQVRVIREDGADDREATITELVLWRSFTETLDALRKLTNEAWPYLTATQREDASTAIAEAGGAL